MTGRKSLAGRARERAWAIHRRRCVDCGCDEPAQADREQAARELTRPPSGLTVGQSDPGMIEWCDGVSAGLHARYGGADCLRSVEDSARAGGAE